MRIIEHEVFTFDELSEEAKQVAIEEQRDRYYQSNDFSFWVLDDCALLEPLESELHKLFGKDYNFPLIKNNRKVYYSLDRNRYIDISKAMEIQNSTQFLQWLGLNKRLIDKIDYTILEDSIGFANQSHLDITDLEDNLLENAGVKFEDHCQSILNHIEENYEYRFSDEAIIDDIQSNEYEFYKSGKLY